MRIPLNQQKADGLYQLLQHLLTNYAPENIAEKLIDDHMREIFERLRKKVVGNYTKEYSLTLNPKEAKAYFIFFNQNNIDLGGWHYEKLIVDTHILLIDKIYG